jgi:uncharacterized protein YceK
MRIPTLILALVSSGCMTFDTMTNRGFRGPYTYSGARADLDQVGQAFLSFNLPFMLLFTIDLPLSTIADTLALPVTFPRERARLAELEQRQRVDIEQAPLVRPELDQPPEVTAQRLFESCRALVKKLDDELLDCYSIRAEIALRPAADPYGAARRISGSQYKTELRAALERLRYLGDAIDWTDAEFEREGNAVRVTATRSTALTSATNPHRLLIGPSSDGGWRILEEEGIEPVPQVGK